MKYKPSFILLDHVSQNEGMNALNRFFVDKKGFDLDAVRTLVVKYPYILSKTEEDLDSFFNQMQRNGLTEE